MDINGHNLFLVQKGMTPFTDIDKMIRVKKRFRAVHFHGQLCFCENKIQSCHNFLVIRQFFRMFSGLSAESRQNNIDLFLFLKIQFP